MDDETVKRADEW